MSRPMNSSVSDDMLFLLFISMSKDDTGGVCSGCYVSSWGKGGISSVPRHPSHFLTSLDEKHGREVKIVAKSLSQTPC